MDDASDTEKRGFGSQSERGERSPTWTVTASQSIHEGSDEQRADQAVVHKKAKSCAVRGDSPSKRLHVRRIDSGARPARAGALVAVRAGLRLFSFTAGPAPGAREFRKVDAETQGLREQDEVAAMLSLFRKVGTLRSLTAQFVHEAYACPTTSRTTARRCNAQRS